MSPDNQCLKFDIDESPTQNWHDNYQEDKDRETAQDCKREREDRRQLGTSCGLTVSSGCFGLICWPQRVVC